MESSIPNDPARLIKTSIRPCTNVRAGPPLYKIFVGYEEIGSLLPPETYYSCARTQLDVAMIDRVARYIKTIDTTQFIVVSLRPQIYEHALCLTGVYRCGMVNGGFWDNYTYSLWSWPALVHH